MKIIISGASGLIGKQLTETLSTAGHTLKRLVRTKSAAKSDTLFWDIERYELNPAELENADAVIHLAGESVAGGRWSEARKELIRKSRVRGTGLLCETLAGLKNPPKVLLSASAIGYYGYQAEKVLTERDEVGNGFLAEVCREWEAATLPALKAGIRVVNLRIGIVLSPMGGALKLMLLPFRLGLGGVVGNGRQYTSWISLDDVLGAIQHALHNEKINGPLNITAPCPVTNIELTRALGQVLHRPTLFPVPAFAARLVFGTQMANETVLASQRIMPQKLLDTGYSFQYSDIHQALSHLIGRIT